VATSNEIQQLLGQLRHRVSQRYVNLAAAHPSERPPKHAICPTLRGLNSPREPVKGIGSLDLFDLLRWGYSLGVA
jgi:hypothetical protein